MINILEDAPTIERRLITQQELDVRRVVFERAVIDPIFFGNAGLSLSGVEIRKVQTEIDAADQEFSIYLAENFVVSNELSNLI
jgi:hypothetical protein